MEVVPLPGTHFSKVLVNFQNQKNTGAWLPQVQGSWSAEQELKLRPDHQPQVLKNLVRSYITVTKTPFSVQMIASLSGEVKPSVLFILTHHLEGDIKDPPTLFKKSRERRPRCHGLCNLCRHWSGWVRGDQIWKWQLSAPLHADV